MLFTENGTGCSTVSLADTNSIASPASNSTESALFDLLQNLREPTKRGHTLCYRTRNSIVGNIIKLRLDTTFFFHAKRTISLPKDNFYKENMRVNF